MLVTRRTPKEIAIAIKQYISDPLTQETKMKEAIDHKRRYASYFFFV